MWQHETPEMSCIECQTQKKQASVSWLWIYFVNPRTQGKFRGNSGHRLGCDVLMSKCLNVLEPCHEDSKHSHTKTHQDTPSQQTSAGSWLQVWTASVRETRQSTHVPSVHLSVHVLFQPQAEASSLPYDSSCRNMLRSKIAKMIQTPCDEGFEKGTCNLQNNEAWWYGVA